MRSPRRAATALAAVILLASSEAVLQERVAASVADLQRALSDPEVGRIVLKPRPGGHALTAAVLPPHSAVVEGRRVELVGQFPGGGVPPTARVHAHQSRQTYVDANQLTQRILVGRGGKLVLRDLWFDDCFSREWPGACVTSLWDASGTVDVANCTLSDATCTHVSSSYGITHLLRANLGVGMYYLDARTVLVEHFDWAADPTIGMAGTWVNITYSCTGGLTHAIDPAWEGKVEGSRAFAWRDALPILAATALGSVCLGIWSTLALHHAEGSTAAEAQLAAAHGYRLGHVLGCGKFGTVYAATCAANRRPVAIKIFHIHAHERRELMRAMRECQMLAKLRHPCLVGMIEFYATETVIQAQQRHVRTAWTSPQTPPPSMPTRPQTTERSTRSLGGLGGLLRRCLPPANTDGGRVEVPRAAGSSASTPRGSASGMQVHLVVDFCDLGTLNDAVNQGRFCDPSTGEPRVYDVVATALDVATGLEYLHAPGQGVIHRDLSTNNVLLKRDAHDPRGFRALLSDFGLSTSSARHSSSTMRFMSTLSFMSPELFGEGDDRISPAADVFGLGVIMFVLAAGRNPYDDLMPQQVLMHKMEPGQAQGPDKLLELPARCPAPYRELVHECTRRDPCARPAAAEVAARLRAMLAVLPPCPLECTA